MNSEKVSTHFPKLYDGCVETDELIKVQDELLDLFEDYSNNAHNNQFILTSDIDGIEQRERALNIIPNPDIEDIEFRRDRLMNRYSMLSPFTFPFFKQRLDDIIGENNWSANVDYNNRILYIETSAKNQNWFEELEFTVNYMKPCNLIFINMPLVFASVLLLEQITYGELIRNYRMSHWKLGAKPFVSMGEEGVIKMPNIPSIKSQLLNDTAEFIKTDIIGVLINNTTKITDFNSKQVTDNLVVLQYAVAVEVTNLITNIKLLGDNDVVLSESNVYVPVTQTVINKHTIKVKEG